MPNQKWEYTTATVNVDNWFVVGPTGEDLNEALKALGSQGWELVSTLPTSHEHRYVLIFKRPS